MVLIVKKKKQSVVESRRGIRPATDAEARSQMRGWVGVALEDSYATRMAASSVGSTSPYIAGHGGLLDEMSAWVQNQ
jgi:hypothetical protein